MNHPTNEQWMSYCYHELSAAEHARLAGHLETCRECSETVRSWEQAQGDLDSWKLAKKQRRMALAPMAFKWAVAASALVLSFCLGRFAWAERDLQAVRAEVSRQVRDEMKRTSAAIAVACEERSKELIKSFIKDISARQARDIQAVYAAMDKVDSQRAADYVLLKKELDTLAVNADAQLRNTERHLIELAVSGQPLSSANSPGE